MHKKFNFVFSFKQLLILILMFSLIIGICGNIAYPFENSGFLILVPLVLIGPFLVIRLYRYLRRLPQRLLKRIFWIFFGLIILVQIYIFSAMPATVYHDPFRVIQQAEQFSTGDIDWTSNYFWRYPNNIPLTILIGNWFKFMNLLGLTPNTAIHVLSMLTTDSLILLLSIIARKISQNWALVVIGQLFFLFSPYAYTYNLQVFYSDVPIYLAVAGTLLILLKWQKSDFKNKRNRYLSLCLLFGEVLLAEVIKPNFLIIAIAAFLTLVLLLITKQHDMRQIWPPFLTIICAIILSFPATKILDNSINFKNNLRYELPVTHWIYMGLNTSNGGSYSGPDTQAASALPNLKAREKADLKGISRRLNTAGLSGLIKLWVTKVGVLLNVANYNRSYTGGYVKSPVWFQSWQTWWSNIASLVLRLAFVTIYALALISLYRLFKERNVTPLIMFSLLTIVGYLAFHTFFWEAEGRYGQAIIPAIFLIIDQAFATNDLALKKLKIKPVVPILASTAAVFMIAGYLKVNSQLISQQGIVTIAQRSQLSSQYGPKTTWLPPHRSVTQNVTIDATNDYFSMLKVNKSKATATLTNRSSDKKFNITAGHTSYKILNQLKPGQYQIKVTNPTNHRQKIWLVKTHAYQLGQDSATTPSPTWGKRSFVYLFSQNRVYYDQSSSDIVKVRK